MTDRLYRYAFDRCGRKGQTCRVTARGTLNSCRVVFADGFTMITTRNALRRLPPPAADTTPDQAERPA